MERSLLKRLRCEERFAFDKTKRAENGVVCGIDEAGRGPWAGRVYAAAVIFDDDVFIEGLDDSKKLSEGGGDRTAQHSPSYFSCYGKGVSRLADNACPCPC